MTNDEMIAELRRIADQHKRDRLHLMCDYKDMHRREEQVVKAVEEATFNEAEEPHLLDALTQLIGSRWHDSEAYQRLIPLRDRLAAKHRP